MNIAHCFCAQIMKLIIKINVSISIFSIFMLHNQCCSCECFNFNDVVYIRISLSFTTRNIKNCTTSDVKMLRQSAVSWNYLLISNSQCSLKFNQTTFTDYNPRSSGLVSHISRCSFIRRKRKFNLILIFEKANK